MVCLNRTGIGSYLELSRHTEVNDPEIVIVLGVGEDHIERLEVEVYDVVVVNELEASGDLSDEYLALLLCQVV